MPDHNLEPRRALLRLDHTRLGVDPLDRLVPAVHLALLLLALQLANVVYVLKHKILVCAADRLQLLCWISLDRLDLREVDVDDRLLRGLAHLLLFLLAEFGQ